MTRIAPKSEEWADPDSAAVEKLITESERIGWRQALTGLEPRFPFFAFRMRNEGLANWHLLLPRPRSDTAVDVGCGFGSLTLGLSSYFAKVIGVDVLRSRARYASLRAAQDQRGTRFLLGSALALPVRTGSVNLVTVNGVLEWAGLFASGSPRALQERLLLEARRVLSEDGTLAVAIENRFAMETLVGMPDTHTQLRFAPALPRGLASMVSRARKGEPFRTFLYDAGGYASLGRRAGFGTIRVFDLISSYNDYDFIVDLQDAASYRLLWRSRAVRTFYPRAGTARRTLSRVWAGGLGRFAYAYLVLMGNDVTTLLDQDHPLWRSAPPGAPAPAQFRFAVNGTRANSLAIVSHDGARIRSIVEVGIGFRAAPDEFACLPPAVGEALGVGPSLSASWSLGGVLVRAHSVIP